MRIFTLSLFLILVFMGRSQAQQLSFSQANVILPQLSYSACAWGDFDNDGDLDLALTGIEESNPVSKIFRNDSGVFTDIQAGLIPLHYGSVEWGDCDHDNDLDLLLTGMDLIGTPYTLIYRNTSGIFTNSGAVLPGTSDGQATWGDYDNDGDLDILLLGNLSSDIYRNDENDQFVKITTAFPLGQSPMGCWVDYNNDGQLDAMVCGYTGDGVVSRLFKNNQGEFTEVTIGPGPILGLHGGQVKWADLDRDGDQDLVITGMDANYEGFFMQYRNDGNDQFTKFAENTSNLVSTSIDLGDFDNDGLPDIILIGRCVGCGGTATTELFQNLGSFAFFPVVTTLPGFKQGGVSWGDYNNDGLTDLLFTGTDIRESSRTSLFLNALGDTSFFAANTPPATPGGLYATTEDNKLILHWNGSTDAQTPKNGLSYNVSVGTQPSLPNIFAPMADLNTGFRMIASPGNASADTTWFLSGLAAGTYYFSVQAIDNGFMPGAFTTPVMYSYAPVGVEQHGTSAFSISPNPCHERLMIRDGDGSSPDSRIRIFNGSGKCCYEGAVPEMIDVSSWPDGIYLLQRTGGKETSSVKFIKNGSSL